MNDQDFYLRKKYFSASVVSQPKEELKGTSKPPIRQSLFERFALKSREAKVTRQGSELRVEVDSLENERIEGAKMFQSSDGLRLALKKVRLENSTNKDDSLTYKSSRGSKAGTIVKIKKNVKSIVPIKNLMKEDFFKSQNDEFELVLSPSASVLTPTSRNINYSSDRLSIGSTLACIKHEAMFQQPLTSRPQASIDITQKNIKYGDEGDLYPELCNIREGICIDKKVRFNPQVNEAFVSYEIDTKEEINSNYKRYFHGRTLTKDQILTQSPQQDNEELLTQGFYWTAFAEAKIRTYQEIREYSDNVNAKRVDIILEKIISEISMGLSEVQAYEDENLIIQSNLKELKMEQDDLKRDLNQIWTKKDDHFNAEFSLIEESPLESNDLDKFDNIWNELDKKREDCKKMYNTHKGEGEFFEESEPPLTEFEKNWCKISDMRKQINDGTSQRTQLNNIIKDIKPEKHIYKQEITYRKIEKPVKANLPPAILTLKKSQIKKSVLKNANTVEKQDRRMTIGQNMTLPKYTIIKKPTKSRRTMNNSDTSGKPTFLSQTESDASCASPGSGYYFTNKENIDSPVKPSRKESEQLTPGFKCSNVELTPKFCS